MPVDQTRVEEFAGRVVCDMAAAMSGVMVNLGHKLGLYRSLHGAGPTSAAALAAKDFGLIAGLLDPSATCTSG